MMLRRVSLVVVGLLVVFLLIIGGMSLLLLSSSGSGDGDDVSSSAFDPFNDVSNSLDSNVNFEPETRGNTPTAGGNTQTQRIVIKSAWLQITVESVPQKISTITTMAEGMGGWVVSSNVRDSGDHQSGSIAIRVPAEQFNAAIESIKADVEDVDSEQIDGQDVTDEYTDLQSRLRNLQTAESQMQTFMEDAQDTNEVLAVYNELVSLRGEIEVAQGRINLLQDSASYSSISVSIFEVSDDDEEDEDEDNPWKPGETIGNAFDSLVVALRAVADVTLWLLIFVAPLAIVVGVPGWLGWRFIGKKLRREPMPTPLESDEE